MSVPIKLYWNTAIFISFCIVYDCSYTTIAKLRSYVRDRMVTELKYVPFGPLQKQYANLSFKLKKSKLIKS